jgi:hypothetical protein
VVGVAGRAAVSSLALLGIGMSIAGASGGLEKGAQSAGVLLAAIAVTMLGRRSEETGWPFLAALFVVPPAIGSLQPPDLNTALYVSCLTVLILAGWRLVSDVSPRLALVEGSVHPSSIDVLGRKEVSKARRVGLPLTVASIAFDGRPTRREIGHTATQLRSLLRETDAIGYAGGDELLAVFFNTPHMEARQAWSRLTAGVSAGIAKNLRAGFAAFPEDNPTWEGLKVVARDRAERRFVDESDHLPVHEPARALAGANEA